MTGETKKQVPCTDAEKWQCGNFMPRPDDTSMEYEYYLCKVCGQTGKLDYEEMR